LLFDSPECDDPIGDEKLIVAIATTACVFISRGACPRAIINRVCVSGGACPRVFR
jgi:hypothetical protein